MASNKVSIVRYMGLPSVQQNIEQTLKENAQDFMVSVAALVNSNQELQECTPKSVLSACLVATGLGLPMNNSLGLAHIIPYNNKVKEKVVDAETGKEKTIERWEKQAQFQMSAKGFKQLAIRTGKYKHLNDSDVREGEYLGQNRLTGEDEFAWVKDDAEREKLPIIGYLAYFRLNTGYEKTLYMTVEQLRAHGLRYSKSFKKGFGNWKDDFDSMARKTVIKLLISRHGLISTKSDDDAKLAKALEADQSVNDGHGIEYPDNEPVDPHEVANQKERDRIAKHIEKATTIEELEDGGCEEALADYDQELREMFDNKKAELKKGKS